MEKKIPYTRKPEEMSVDEWQTALRRQFAADQKFKIKNIGTHPVFSDFEVYNPDSGKTYKVSIRDNVTSFNFCSCPDFTISALGTCKHIEYALYYFSKYKKYQKYLDEPYIPSYSSLSIFYGKIRKIRLKMAYHSEMPIEKKDLFDSEGFLYPGMIGKLSSFIDSALKSDPSFRVYPDVYEFIQHHEREEHLKKIAGEIFKDGIDSIVFDRLIHGNLYNYQKEGVQKIVETRRILLADEMGLGKTIQAIVYSEIN